MKTSRKISIICGALWAFLLVGCQTPQSALDASKHAQKESLELDRYSHDLLDRIKDATIELEKVINDDRATIERQLTSVKLKQLSVFKEYVDAKRGAIIAQFDSAIHALETEQFEKALETNYNDPINKAVGPKIAQHAQLRAQSTNAPSDLQLARRAMDQERQILDILKIAAEKENELRKSFRAKVIKARDELSKESDEKFKPVLARITAIQTKALAETNFLRADLGKLRGEIKAHQEKIREGFDGHAKTLQAVDNWINRPSDFKSFLLGAISVVKPSIDAGLEDLGKKLSLGEGELAQLGKVVDSAVKSAIAVSEDKLKTLETDVGKAIADATKEVNESPKK